MGLSISGSASGAYASGTWSATDLSYPQVVSFPGGSTGSVSGNVSGSWGPIYQGYNTNVAYSVSCNQYGNYSTTVYIGDPPPSYPPSWTDYLLAEFQATVVYSDGVAATNMNYSGSYSVSSGSLPTGISLNSSTGAVIGLPTVAGQSYSFNVQASNSYGSIGQAFSGTVAAAPTAGKIRTWNGTAWVYGPVKVWNGTTWATGTVKVWNGTAWVTSA